jgi:hypothetical protein
MTSPPAPAITLPAGNALFTTWAAVLDTRRFSAVVRSLGATPEQTVAGLTVSPARIGPRRPVAEILQAETP